MLPCALSRAASAAPEDCNQPLECDEEDPALCTQYVPGGCLAPFTGVLYSPRASAETTTELELWPERLELAVTATAARWRAEAKYERDMRAGEKDAASKREQLAEDRIGKLEARWPATVWLGIGAGGTALIVLLGALAFN